MHLKLRFSFYSVLYIFTSLYVFAERIEVLENLQKIGGFFPPYIIKIKIEITLC